MRNHTLIAALALAVAAGGCEEAFGPSGQLAPDEVVELSDALIQEGLTETADTSTAGTLTDGVALDVITSSTEFTWVHSCPLGGEVTMTGTRSRTRDSETRTGTLDVSATRTFVDCARPLVDSTVITLNGEVTLTAHREWQAGSWHGAQELTLSGSVSWVTDDDRSGTCVIDVEASFDPATHTRTVTGTVCGEDVGAFRGWTFGTAGHGPGHHQGGSGPHGGGPNG